MSKPILICDQISKSYQIAVRHPIRLLRSTRRSFNETVTDKLQAGISRLKGFRRGEETDDNTFWALNNVCFEVQRGEVIGLVGSNGAGKSTLLKILSRIVEPTEGTIRLRGRVASLLEVGTGFHGELSGRENIYLNGAILGMKKAEIDRKFDEIVAFSEIEKFLDMPVKRYSSGMYIRLAFAVAAHLEPEILIVDEVLAVGDFAFQKKCLGKMHDVAASTGRTILFVSHNMSALSQLCERGVLLEKGVVTAIGPIKDVIKRYLKGGLDRNRAQAFFERDDHKPCQYKSVEILHGDGSLGSEFSCDEPVTIRLRFEVREFVPGLFLTFLLQNFDGTQVLFSDIRDTDESIPERLGVGLHTFEITIPPRLLAPTTYLVTVSSSVHFLGVVTDHHDTCCEFSLRDLSTRMIAPGRSGVVGVLLAWDHQQSPSSHSTVEAAVPPVMD
jgi:lipopolysaccharide transport system ATP-binding protein